MKYSYKLVLFFLISIMLNAPTLATVVALDTSESNVTVGNSVNIDLTISGLGNGEAPTLGAFYVEILFDDTILNFDNVVYGSLLGNTDPRAFETDIITIDDAGFVSLDQFSFLFDFELDAIQPDTFTLATVTFNTIGAGVSAIDFNFVDLSTANGDFFDPDLAGTSVKVVTPVSASAPYSITLLLFGMGALFIRRQKHLQHSQQL
jgi:hypothetical protein